MRMGIRGPRLEHWTKAVVDDHSLPPIQRGEHVTVGQVRHPEMQEHFRAEFEKWHLQTKTEMNKLYKPQKGRKGVKKQPGRKAKKPPAYDEEAPCAPWLIECLSTGRLTEDKDIENFRKRIATEVAELLGWGKITNRQLLELLQAYSADDALQLLLRGSTQYSQASREQYKTKLKQTQRKRKVVLSDDDDSDGSDNEEEDATVEFDDKHSWFQLKPDIPVDSSVRVGEVPDTDPREKLRGYKGIWATKDVPAHHILGPYRHYLTFLSTYEDILRNPRPGKEDRSAEWKLELDSYACDDNSFQVEKEGIGQYSLSYSAYGYGNATAYANDPHQDPIGSLCKELPEGRPDEYLGPKIKNAEGQELDENCMVGVVSIAGWPYMFMYTTQPVKKGQEFLYSYGHGYWNLNLQNINRVLESEKLRKLLDENKDLRERATQLTSGLTTSMQTATPSVAAPSATASAAGTAASLLPAPAVSGLSSLGRNMQDMQLTITDKTADQQGDIDQQEGVGESPAGKAPKKRFRAEGSPAVSGVGSGLATADAQHSDDDDEASSVMMKTVMAYKNLVVNKQRQEQLQKTFAAYKDKQATMVIQDKDGRRQDVTRVKDPRVAKLIHEAEMQLSRILYMFSSGIAYSKFKDRGWWSSELHQYEYDRWEFIRRRPLYFQMSQDSYSPTTVVSLTDEWRQELESLAESEGWKKPQSADGAGYAGRTRKRTREVVYLPDARASEELQLKKQKLQEAQSQLQEAQHQLQQALGLLRSIQQHLQKERILLPPHLQEGVQSILQRCQQRAVQSPHEVGTATAAVEPQAGGAASDAGGLAGFDLRGAPIPGMGGGGDSEYSSSEDEKDQQEPSLSEDDAGSEDGRPPTAAAAAPSNGRAAIGSEHVGGSQSGRSAASSVRAGKYPVRHDVQQQPHHEARPHHWQPPAYRQPPMQYSPAQAAQQRSSSVGRSHGVKASRQQEDYGRMQRPAASNGSGRAGEQHMPPPYARHQPPARYSDHNSAQQPQHLQGSGQQYDQYGYGNGQQSTATEAWVGGQGQLTAAMDGQHWAVDHRQQGMQRGPNGPRHVAEPHNQRSWQQTGQHGQYHGRQSR